MKELKVVTHSYTVQADGEHFKVSVATSPQDKPGDGDAEEVVLTTALRDSLQELEVGGLSRQRVLELGRELGKLLFPPGARARLAAVWETMETDETLRVWLELSTYALADIPWEYVHIPFDRSEENSIYAFLALRSGVSLVRYEGQSRPEAMLPPLIGPVRMVTFFAEPPGYPALNLQEEQERTYGRLVGSLKLEHVPHFNTTADVIRQSVRTNPHIIHFACHGRFEITDRTSDYRSMMDDGYLVLCGEADGAGQARANKHESTKLGMTLRGNKHLRLVLLGACEAGRFNRVNAWTGVVPSLTHAGVQVIVGLQYKMNVESARLFRDDFFKDLLNGKTIDEAMNRGRTTVVTSDADFREWGVPVLYMRAGGQATIFPAAGSRAATSPAPPEQQSGVTYGMSASFAGARDSRVYRGAAEGPALPDDVTPNLLPAQAAPALVSDGKLRQAISDAFDVTELEELCADIEDILKREGIGYQVNLDVIGARGKPKNNIILSLIGYLGRRGLLPYLMEAVRNARPHLLKEGLDEVPTV